LLISQFDSDGNGQIETHELKAALVAMSVTMKDYNVTDNDVKTWLAAFDRDGDGLISRAEFCGGMTHWVLEQTSGGLEQHRPGRRSRDGAGGYDRVDDRIFTAREGTEPLLRYDGAPASPGPPRFPFRDHGAGSDCDETSDDETSDDDAGDETDNETPPTRGQIVRQSVTRLAAGMVLIALFADPMVGAVSSLSSALGLRSPFFASFVITPFASNASELVSSLYFASKKRKKNISLTYSQIYGAVTMNNTMCLGLFLVVMRARGLRWTFTSETITIVVATFAVGFVGARRKTLKTSLLLPVMCIYPAALGLVAFLDGVLGLQ
jgi:Ca2+/Na+ antiporter